MMLCQMLRKNSFLATFLILGCRAHEKRAKKQAAPRANLNKFQKGAESRASENKKSENNDGDDEQHHSAIILKIYIEIFTQLR